MRCAMEFYGKYTESKLEEVARFFWERHKRACQMDAINKELGAPTHYWIQSDEWTEAFKNTLSSKKLKEFNRAWDKFDKELDFYHNKAKDKEKKTRNPMRV